MIAQQLNIIYNYINKYTRNVIYPLSIQHTFFFQNKITNPLEQIDTHTQNINLFK